MARLFKALLLALLGAAVFTVAAWHWLLATDSGSRFLLRQAQQALGSEAVAFTGVEGSLRGGLTLQGLRLSLAAADVEVDQLQLVVQPGLRPLAVFIPRLAASGVRINSHAPANNAATRVLNLTSLHLPFPLSIEQAELQQLAWYDSQQLELLALDEAVFAASWHQALRIDHLQLRQGELVLQLQGSLELDDAGRHELQLALPAWPQYGLRGISLGLQGSLARSAVQLSAEYPPLQVEGYVEGLAGTPVLSLDAHLQAPLQGAAGAALLPEGYTLQALQLGLQGPPEHIRLQLDAQADTPFVQGVALRGQGEYLGAEQLLRFSELLLGLDNSNAQLLADGEVNLDSQLLDATVAWQNLAWPPAALQGETALVSSPDGRLELSGAFSSWQLSGRLALEAPGYPGGEVQLAASGGETGAEVGQLRLQALGGSAEGVARLSWGEAFAISGQLELAQLDLAAINPGLPLDVGGRLGFAYDAAGDTELQLDALSGQWLGEAVTASGKLRLLPGDFIFEGIALDSGAARLQLDGALRSPAGIAFQVQADGDGWPGGAASGALKAQGRAGLQAGVPELELELDARQLVVGSHSVEALTASGNLAGGIELAASGLNAFGVALESLAATLRQGADSSALEWRVQQGENRLSGALAGTALQLGEQFEPRWQGQLQAFEWLNAGRELFALVAPAELELQPGSWSLADACLQSFAGGQLCLARIGQMADGLALEGEVRDFPLGIVQELLQNDLQMTQQLSGPFRFTRQARALPSGNASLSISPGRLSSPEIGTVLESSEGYMGFTLERGQLRDGRVELEFPGVGQLNLDLAIDGVAFDGTGRLQGHLRAEVLDAAPFGVLLPSVDSLQGRAVVDLQVSGITADPALSGRVELGDGGVVIPALGLRVWGLDLAGEVSERDLLEMSGSARLGEGLAELQAQVEFSDWWSPQLRLDVAGSNLQVVNLPDLTATLDPQLSLVWAGGTATLSGSARLHNTLVQPLAGFVTPIEESPDLVIIGTLPGQAPAAARARQPLALYGSVAVTVGDQVRFQSDLASATLGGELRLDWNGALLPQAEGAISLNGQVSAFGPRLAMEDSFLRFNGGSVSNPTLDLSATRNVFGNTQVRAAGVRIIGSANRPEIEAFTVPYTDQERAWALLITGSDLNYGQGIGGFDIGAYIAPRLYISFGVSLFDEDTVVGVRYDLRRNFGVRATSGQRGSGIDATYTIDH
jgi:translocation and assembly module TamB